MVGAKLQRLEAGWLSEGDEDRVWEDWTRIFPQQLFRKIAARGNSLTVVRFPGFALYRGQPEAEVRRLLEEYVDIGLLGRLPQLQRLDLSMAQLLEDPAVVKIARGCRRLRSLCLRGCENVSDQSLLAVAEQLAGTLVHVNISCCQFSEKAVRRLMVRCRGLKSLDLCYCKGLGPNLLSFLCKDPTLCPHLYMIGAGGMDVSDEEVTLMCRKYRETLTHLGIGAAARLTDKGLRMLAELPYLERLSAHQLQRISTRGLTEFCLTAPRLRDLDADGCEYTPAPTPEELQALHRCLAEKPYDYSACDESDDEDAERQERERKEKADKERRERERREKERADKRKERGDLLLAMEQEMGGFMP